MSRFRKATGRPIRLLFHHLGYEVTPIRPEFPPDFDEDTATILRAVRPYTMTTPERLFALCESVRYLYRNQIGGAIVECGVWRGGSIMAVAMTLLALGVSDRDLYLFDTFDGMTLPTKRDVDLNGNDAANFFGNDLEAGENGGTPSSLLLPSPVDEVRSAVESTGYPMEHVFFVPGRVEDTVPASAPAQIALLRLDTDWYESTLHELAHLYPRVSSGGVVVIDDYGHWRGAKEAVDEYIAANDVPIMLSRIDYSCRIAVVP